MQKRVISLILAVILMGCNLPTRAQPSPTVDPVSTQVSLLLTNMPSATALTDTQPTQTETPTPLRLPSDTPQQPTAEPTAETTSTTAAPQAAATLTPTISPSDPKSSLGSPAYQNLFDSDRGLYLYESENTRITHENGSLLLSGLTADGWHGWSLIYSRPSQNFYLEGVFRTQTCAGSDLYGLVFRAEGSEAGYFFGVTCDGRYNLHARNFTDGADLKKIDLTANSAIQSGSNAVNRLGVMANGERISLYANGVLLQDITDSAYTKEGNFGPFIAANATTGFTVHLDELALWDLPGY